MEHGVDMFDLDCLFFMSGIIVVEDFLFVCGVLGVFGVVSFWLFVIVDGCVEY